MLRLAMSTVGCPQWTLEEVAAAAAKWEYHGVELRTFGYGSTQIACDPALSAPGKTRRTFAEAGVAIMSLAASERFDQAIRPRIIGRVIGDQEAPVRRTSRLIDLAAELECPLVRVFAFEAQAGEPRSSALNRIAERLGKVLDHADRTGVRVAIENGGSWPTAAGLGEILARMNSPLLGASYSMAVAHQAGEDVVAGAAGLGDALLMSRLKDVAQGKPVPLGDGQAPCERFVSAMARRTGGWLVAEWDRLWWPDLAPAEDVLPETARRVASWQESAPGRPRHLAAQRV